MKTFGTILLTVFVCLILAATMQYTVFGARFTEDRTTTAEHVAGKPINVTTANGAVTVTRSEGKEVRITARLRATTQERLDAAKVLTQRKDDGTLDISVEWPTPGRKSNEGCAFEILIPDCSAVTARSSNGSLGVTGFTATIDLDTSNGAVTVTDVNGNVSANSSNGRVTVTNVVGDVAADTSNGAIVIRGVQGALQLDTSNGSIEVVQAGDGAWPVNADTSNGSVSLELAPSFAGELSMETSNGSIRTQNLRGATIVESGKKSLRLMFGESKNKSVIDTSNGSITLTVRDGATPTAGEASPTGDKPAAP